MNVCCFSICFSNLNYGFFFFFALPVIGGVKLLYKKVISSTVVHAPFQLHIPRHRLSSGGQMANSFNCRFQAWVLRYLSCTSADITGRTCALLMFYSTCCWFFAETCVQRVGLVCPSTLWTQCQHRDLFSFCEHHMPPPVCRKP